MESSDGPEVWLVRHGETEWSKSGKHTSTTDLDLTPHGVDVAKGLKDRLADLDFSLVLSSPRKRARVTAELAGFSEFEVDDDLAEWSYGEYEGITTPEIRETVPGWTIWTHPAPGGETAEQVTERLDRVIARTEGHDRVLMFSHGHALRALAARWILQPVAEGRFFYLDTSTISVLGYDRGSRVIRHWNAALV